MKLANKHFYIIRIGIILAVLVTVGLLGWLYLQKNSQAADMSRFDPGNIMSDSVMMNKDSMGVQQIQAFLDSKNACNNTNTYMASWYPHLQYNIQNGRFVCMAQERFNGKSAAQIIWQVSQEYTINPQVLIVLLEKEQGLVSDTWPNYIQYRTAAGFGCPDTAPCEAQYFGLENQLRHAANLFRSVLNGGWSNYPVGNTYVQYHPNAACGGTIVNIQNRATSALYRYTPYQPNASALAAGYGTGDGCGAYGNRNFWALFTDWFGSTQQTPSFEKMETARYLTPVKDGVRKINLTTYQETDAPLTIGQLVYFTGKTVYNNSVCLRTRFDRDVDNQYCIPFDQLKEVDINYTDTTRKKIEVINPDAKKINPVTESSLGVLSKGQYLAVSQELAFNGASYYRSVHDVAVGTHYNIKASDVREVSVSITPIPETTFTIKSHLPSYKTNIWTSAESTNLQPLRYGQSITFAGAVEMNNGLYYISKLDYAGQDSIYAIRAELLNQYSFSDISPIKNMRTIRDTCKFNLEENTPTSICYPPNTILSFDSFTTKEDKRWNRTTWETLYNTQLVIDPADLAEV